MRGEFLGVWPETWREIWLPLTEVEGVPNDIFCEIYRELIPALRIPSDQEAANLAINDAIQSRQIFELALSFANINVDLARWNQIYDSVPKSESSTISRKTSLAHAVASIVGDEATANGALARALKEATANPVARDEARNRAHEIILNDKQKSRDAIERTTASDLAGECAVVGFVERIHLALEDLAGDPISNRYFNLLVAFIERFSLRYDLRRPCLLCPTLPGVFATLVRDLKNATSQDTHLDGLMKDYEDAIRDLRTDCSGGRIRTCMVKQVNLMEAMGNRFPGVSANTMGQICDQVGTWPHNSVKDAMKNLYRFTCNYPGIRHAGEPASALRVIDMRDMVAMSILLTGFMPYLTDQLNAATVYRGT